MKIDRSFFIDKKTRKTSEELTLRKRELSVVSSQVILCSEGGAIASKRKAVGYAVRWSI